MEEHSTPERSQGEPKNPVIPGAIYNSFGVVMIAIDDTHLVPIMRDDSVRSIATDAVELLERPGSEDWVNRMIRTRKDLARTIFEERDGHRRLEQYLEGLREAILEKAVQHDWCREYDEFASEWNLLPRNREYEVSVFIPVMAKDEEDARELVYEHYGLSSTAEFSVGEPTISVSEV